jgi:hypothetical protein
MVLLLLGTKGAKCGILKRKSKNQGISYEKKI